MWVGLTLDDILESGITLHKHNSWKLKDKDKTILDNLLKDGSRLSPIRKCGNWENEKSGQKDSLWSIAWERLPLYGILFPAEGNTPCERRQRTSGGNLTLLLIGSGWLWVHPWRWGGTITCTKSTLAYLKFASSFSSFAFCDRRGATGCLLPSLYYYYPAHLLRNKYFTCLCVRVFVAIKAYSYMVFDSIGALATLTFDTLAVR